MHIILVHRACTLITSDSQCKIIGACIMLVCNVGGWSIGVAKCRVGGALLVLVCDVCAMNIGMTHSRDVMCVEYLCVPQMFAH